MGQLAQTLRNPQSRLALRSNGGTFEYGDPIPLIEDLVATRRAWPDATLLANDNIHRRMYGYIAFWEDFDPRLDFLMPRSALDDCKHPQVREMFRSSEGRATILRFVEREGTRGFDTRQDESPRASSWSRLVQDDDPV